MNEVAKSLSASDLFALATLTENKGDQRCHWCGSSCDRTWLHDDDPPIPFVKNKQIARCPGNPWICKGCFNFRRPRITVRYLDNTFRDCLSPQDCSWFVTRSEARAIRWEHTAELYKILLKPPHQFVLALLTEAHERLDVGARKIKNRIHMADCNDLVEVKAGTELKFTLDNIPHIYTVNELEEALRRGTDGKTPGTQALVRLLGLHKLPEEPKREPKPGKPPALPTAHKTLEKIVSKSGEQFP